MVRTHHMQYRDDSKDGVYGGGVGGVGCCCKTDTNHSLVTLSLKTSSLSMDEMMKVFFRLSWDGRFSRQGTSFFHLEIDR